MVDRDTLGRRIREVRTSRKMTLKEVEAASGFSATHISEIERGRTSPTIGALVKIASALGRDPNYFIDDHERDVVSFVGVRERQSVSAGGARSPVETLTRGVVGGRFEGSEIRLSPGEVIAFDSQYGEECGIVLEGRVELTVGEHRRALGPNEAFHYAPRRTHAIRNVGAEQARLILVANRNSLI